MAIRIRSADITVEPVRGGGPGGQHRNKKWTGVRLTHLPTGIVVVATERRSQTENKRIGMARLREKVTKYHHRPKKRRATRPTKASKTRRLTQKRQASEKKQARGKVRQD